MKIIAVVLIFALTFTTTLEIFSQPVNAEPAIKDTYVFDGITYYNANSQNINSDKKFYVDLLTAKNSVFGGRSLAEMWLMAAAGLSLQTPQLNYQDTLTDIAKEIILGTFNSSKYAYYASYSYSAPTWHNSDGGYVEVVLKVTYLLYEFNITLHFSDFRVGALLPADQSLYVQTVTENGSTQTIGASSVKNDTGSTITATQSTTKSIAESITSTVNHSSSYSFTEGVKLGVEASSFGIYKMSAEISASFSQAFSDGWSKSKATTNSKSTTSGVSVTLPPYTNVLVRQGEAKTTVTTKYNCPVILGYQVLIKLDRGTLLPIGLYTFGSTNSNARKDLYHRAFEEGSKNLDSESIDWEKVLKDSDAKDAITKITNNVPMSSSGASIVYTNDTTYTEVAGTTALYPLRRTVLEKTNIPFIDENGVVNMKVGNYSYTKFLKVVGYNAYNAEYYGFNKDKGKFIIVDENKKELPASTAPVVLEEDNVSGLIKFKAVRPGKCYLQYMINENAYPAAINSTSYTKNSDLDAVATLEINVSTEDLKYKITGNYEGRVNSVAENIEGDNKLTVAAYNNRGLEVDSDYVWEQRETKKKGINLQSDGKISFTKSGTFHVRVADSNNEDVYSDWKEITAISLGDDEDTEDEKPTLEAVDEYTTLVISGNFVGGVSADPEYLEGDDKLTVTAYDSTGREKYVAYTWEAQDGQDAMTINGDGLVSFDATGSYYVRVKATGDDDLVIYSEWTEITVNELPPVRIIKAPTATQTTYDGTSQVLLNEDAEYEGGSRIMYGLGDDENTAPNEYSTELPAAVNVGTYYAWYKIIGDVNHDDTDAKCVVASISAWTEPEEEEEQKTDTKKYCDKVITKTYTLSNDVAVFWRLSDISQTSASYASYNAQISASVDDFTVSWTPQNAETVKTQNVTLSISTIAGKTEVGEYAFNVQVSEDGENWTDKQTLNFEATSSSEDEDPEDQDIEPSTATLINSTSSGCNFGFSILALGFALTALIKRKAH